MEKVERTQYQAAIAITGAWKGSNRLKIYEELGWESLSDRRLSRRILQIFKIIADKTPHYLKAKLPPNRLPFLAHVYRDFRCRTVKYKNSFFPHSISIWNEIITHFEQLPTQESLKKHLIALFRPLRKSIFGVHEPNGTRILFQLRVGLSPLRSHKKRHNFADTISDKCLCKNGVEDTRHFFTKCPFYYSHRVNLNNDIHTILRENNLMLPNDETDLYLYGHSSLSDSENRRILLSTIKYIQATKRFNKE